MNHTHQFSPSTVLIMAVKRFEGYADMAYKCPAGVWTIGYGHTRGVKPGMTVTLRQAETLLRGDLAEPARFVNSLHLCTTQGQFDALVDFTFNLGTDRLIKSTLIERIRQNAPQPQIRAEFLRWCYAAGRRLPGLLARREWEARRFFETDNGELQ